MSLYLRVSIHRSPSDSSSLYFNMSFPHLLHIGRYSEVYGHMGRYNEIKRERERDTGRYREIEWNMKIYIYIYIYVRVCFLHGRPGKGDKKLFRQGPSEMCQILPRADISERPGPPNTSCECCDPVSFISAGYRGYAQKERRWSVDKTGRTSDFKPSASP